MDDETLFSHPNTQNGSFQFHNFHNFLINFLHSPLSYLFLPSPPSSPCKQCDKHRTKQQKPCRPMHSPPPRPHHLRESHMFLSNEQAKPRRFKFCCCDDSDLQGEQLYVPIFSMSPQPKISIKKMNKRSQNAWTHSNSEISIGKLSQRSHLLSKKASQLNVETHPSISDKEQLRPHCTSHSNNIKFIYSNANQRNAYNIKAIANSQPLIPAPNPNPHAKQYKIPAKAKQIDENIEKEFMNILQFGESGKESRDCGDPFPIDNPQHSHPPKPSFHGMPNFSFGQHQKHQFMSQYLGIKHQTSQQIIISSKQNSKRSQLMKSIREQKLSKHSKSSKSSGQIFVRGTFNKPTLNSLAKRRDLLYEYRSQSDLSLQSSQSLVLQTYQSIMKKRGSFIRDYQY